MVQVSLNMGWAILNAAGLSFIGLGVRPPNAEWGIMVAEGSNYIISGEWWLVIFPGAALMLAVFCFINSMCACAASLHCCCSFLSNGEDHVAEKPTPKL